MAGGTNNIDYDVLAFDSAVQERAYANIPMPASWDGGVIQFRTLWTATTSTGTFKLDLAGRSLADDDAIDQAVGTYVGATDTLITAGDMHISAWSGDVTITGAGAGELIHLEMRRDVATDTLGADARLIAVQIRYKQAQYTD